MSYLEEFHSLSDASNPTRFLRLWEEYCLSDTVDGEELLKILTFFKNTPISALFGSYAETVLPLWKQIPPGQVADKVLASVVDLQTGNSPILADLATEFLKTKYSSHKYFSEMIRIVGLRSRQNFQGAISHFELLVHMEKGKFVFHTGGWGVGEVIEVSLLREHVLIEFEGFSTVKEMSFENALKHLIPLSSEHFLARRFGDPDRLEKEGREDPVKLIHLLLKDLGPKSASEIKDELSDLVIPEADYTKWWQNARAKLKKDTHIQSPESPKNSFILRDEEVSHESRLHKSLKGAKNRQELILTVYNYTRDFPEVLKNTETRELVKSSLESAHQSKEGPADLLNAQQIQILFLLEDLQPQEFKSQIETIFQAENSFDSLLSLIEIVAFKKRFLVGLRERRKDWKEIFLKLLFSIEQNTLRDYIFKELEADPKTKIILKEKIHELLHRLTVYPDAFLWYFQKLSAGEDIPLNDPEHKRYFLEGFFVLLHYVENTPDLKDLIKKMHQTITAKRYVVVRDIIQGASLEYLQELLLLASKCNTLTKQDHRILQSLAQVVQPSLVEKHKEEGRQHDIIWTTAEGYKKIQERIHHLGTVETVDNAREIEAARELGDLRENSEYKFALERRSRLQAELKLLSRQVNQARVLTKEDITTDEVGVGSIVDVVDSNGNKVVFTLLGPWDADPDRHVLSFQSKFAQAMIGCKKGESFDFQGEHYTVKGIRSFL